MAFVELGRALQFCITINHPDVKRGDGSRRVLAANCPENLYSVSTVVDYLKALKRRLDELSFQHASATAKQCYAVLKALTERMEDNLGTCIEVINPAMAESLVVASLAVFETVQSEGENRKIFELDSRLSEPIMSFAGRVKLSDSQEASP